MAKKLFYCSGCDKSVFKYVSQLTRTDIVFCSLLCRNKNYKKAVPEWRPHNYKEYSYVCKNCNCSFTKTGSNHNPNKRSYCSVKCKSIHLDRKPHSKETKIKLSMAAARQNKNYISKHLYNGVNGQLSMKSSWEVRFAKWLDSQLISWKYEPEFRLSNGYVYLPDFQLSTGDIIEIKGYMREDAQVKWDLFCADYPDLKKSLLRKDDLKKLGLI